MLGHEIIRIFVRLHIERVEQIANTLFLLFGSMESVDSVVRKFEEVQITARRHPTRRQTTKRVGHLPLIMDTLFCVFSSKKGVLTANLIPQLLHGDCPSVLPFSTKCS